MNKPIKIIFLGNGTLAEAVLKHLRTVSDFPHEIIFHAHTAEDLEEVKKIKLKHPDAYGVLASFGVIIKDEVLKLFEPMGILNIHPSLLPEYRGASPIETAILNGDTNFGVSVMKLIPKMDAGPIYAQATHKFKNDEDKLQIYDGLAELGVTLLRKIIKQTPLPTPQNDDNATYTTKLDKTMSILSPAKKSAQELRNQVRAFSGFPKSRLEIMGMDCIILSAHVAEKPEKDSKKSKNPLNIKCADNKYLIIDELQPAGKKAMSRKAFLNGYV